jgi:MFS transporter, PPP family, 3-phenylpropionic acid transporter
MPDSGVAARGTGASFTIRLGLFYAALFLIYGLHLPYFPVWLDARGLTAAEIAAVTGAPYFIRLVVTPGLALWADRWQSHRGMVIALSWVSLGFLLVLTQMGGFWALFSIAVLLALAMTTIMPLTETICVSGVRESGLDYGRMRLWGSLTFIGVGLLGGAFIDRYSAASVIWLLVCAATITVGAALILPRPAADPQETQNEPSAQAPSVVSDAWTLARAPLFLIFLLSVGAVQGAHAMFYTFGALHWQSQGLSTAWIGALWSAGVLAEVLLFAYSGAVVRRVGPALLIVAGSAAAILRWSLMSFDPPFWALWPLQILHALTYSATHLGAIHFISRAVPTGAAGTAQALYATVAMGVVMGGATFASGSLYASFGGAGYLAMSALSGVGLLAALALLKGWDGGVLWRHPAPSASPTTSD